MLALREIPAILAFAPARWAAVGVSRLRGRRSAYFQCDPIYNMTIGEHDAKIASAFDVFYKFLHTILHAEFTEEVDEYSDLAVIPEGMAVHFPYSCKASLREGLPRRFTDIGEH
jgi:hypothetical protein